MKKYYIILLFTLLESNHCFAQQTRYRVTDFSNEETSMAVHMKNGTPMTPVEEMIDKVFFGFPAKLQFEFNGDKVTYQNKTYQLNEAVDTIDNQIFVPADFYPKVLNHSIGFCTYHSKIETDNHSFDCELTETSTLFIKKGKAFQIKLLDSEKSPLGELTTMPDNGTITVEKLYIMPTVLYKAWIVDYDADGNQRRYEKDIYGHYKWWSITIDEAGEYILTVENTHEKFTIIVVD